MSISLPRRLLSHSTSFGETSAAVQHTSENSATKLWLEFNWNMPRQCGTTSSSAIPPQLKLYSEAQHVSPAIDYRRTTSVTAMLQKLQWDSPAASSPYSRVLMQWRCTISAMDRLPFLPQPISSQLWSTSEGSKPATERSSAAQACTITPSFLVQSDYGTPCQLMSASCHLTVLRLN